MKHVRNLVLVLGAMSLASVAAYADDTDIYLTPSTVSRDDSPNVMIILDNSGSMADQVQTATYDSTTSYTYAGAGTGFDVNKIYWVTGNQTIPTSATSYPGQYFSVSNNRCSSMDLSKGGYSDQAAAWNTTNGWVSLSTTDLQVECKTDQPADAAGTYAKANASGATPQYTGTSSQKLGGNKSNYFNGLPTYTFYSGNYLNYLSTLASPTCSHGGTADAYGNYDTAAGWCPSKMQLAKAAVKAVIDGNPNVRFGLMVFNQNAPKSGSPVDGDDASGTDGTPWNGGRVVFPIQNMDSTAVSNLKSIVDSIVPSTNTPLAETLYEAYLYFAGKPVLYGNGTKPTSPAADQTQADLTTTPVTPGARTKADINTYQSPFLYSCQQAYVILVTDGDPTADQNANTSIAALSGIGTPANTIHDVYQNKNYVDYLDVLAGWMYNNDVYSGMANTQRVVTYPIGFNAKYWNGSAWVDSIVNGGLPLLQSAADMGQGKAAGQGLFTAATDGATLANAMQTVINDAQLTTSSFAAPALSVNAFNRLFNRDDVYFAMFKPSTTSRWDGNVKKFKLNSTGDVVDQSGALAIDPVTQRIKSTATSYWTASGAMDGGTITQGGAGAKIPTYDTTATPHRTVYTYIGAYTGLPAALSGAAYQFVDGNAAITSNILGLPVTATAAQRTNLINWVRGQNRWAFGDPLHSRPVAITYGSDNSGSHAATCGSSGTSTSIIKLFVATNDGMLHMINDCNGTEEWAFIPQELLGMQYTLSVDGPGTHPYGLDGTPTFWVVDNNNNGIIEPSQGDHVYMYIGMRRGGRNIYAFDVTPGSTLADATSTTGIVPKLMWVIRGGVDTDYMQLGYTYSKPAIAQISVNCHGAGCATGDAASQTVLIFGGGYDMHQDSSIPTGVDAIPNDGTNPSAEQGMGNAIYIADPSTGARIWWASGGRDVNYVAPTLTVSGMSYSIASDLALLDTNADGLVDRIYAPDTGGRIWRVDLGANLDVGTNAGTVAYMFANLSSACSSVDLQDCRKFFYPPDYVQVSDSNFSSTTDYDVVTIESGDREDPLDNQTVGLGTPVAPVHNRIYALRDYQITSLAGTGSAPTAITESKLYDATADVLQDPTGASYATDKATLQASKGWYVSLWTGSAWVGEKGLAKTDIFSGVLYATTYTPPSQDTAQITCYKDEGLGKLYALNVLDATAVYDYSGDQTVNKDDRQSNLGGGIPSELVIVIRQSGVSGLVGTSGGAAKPAGIPSGSPRFNTYWYQQ